MPAPMSSSPQVVALLSLSNAALQRRALKVFKESGQSSMSRDRIVKAIAAAEGVKTLRGAPRDEFRKHVNAAIGVLLKKSPPKIVRHGTTNSAVALPKRRATGFQSSRTQPLSAVRDRLVLIRFTCVECGEQNEVQNLDAEGWCDCLTSFFEKRKS